MNKRGSTLVMIIFLVMLLSVIALSLFTIMVTDKKLVVQQEDSMQSYYLARSGADIVAEHIINHPLDIAILDGLTSDSFNYGGSGDGFTVRVAVESTYASGEVRTIRLYANGQADNREKNIELQLSRITMDHAIFSEADMDIGAMDIVDGDLGSNGFISGTPNVRTGDNEDEMGLTIHSQPFPSYASASNINENSDYTFTTQNSGIDNIRLNLPSGTITYDTSGGDIEIVVNDFYSKGDIEVTGSGRVVLYVESIANFQTPSISMSDPDQFIIYLKAGSAINFSTPLGFMGRVIGPEATVNISSNSTFTGSIIAGHFYGTSNSSVIYDAPAEGALILGYQRSEWR